MPRGKGPPKRRRGRASVTSLAQSNPTEHQQTINIEIENRLQAVYNLAHTVIRIVDLNDSHRHYLEKWSGVTVAGAVLFDTDPKKPLDAVIQGDDFLLVTTDAGSIHCLTNNPEIVIARSEGRAVIAVIARASILQ
jgi:hypothetical protein